MSENHQPEQLDANVEFPENHLNSKNGSINKKHRFLPWLLAALGVVVIYAFIQGSGSASVRTELTPEEQQQADGISEQVNLYLVENGVPDNPSEMNLPEGTEIVFNEDGSWIASTTSGQLVSSDGSLIPR